MTRKPFLSPVLINRRGSGVSYKPDRRRLAARRTALHSPGYPASQNDKCSMTRPAGANNGPQAPMTRQSRHCRRAAPNDRAAGPSAAKPSTEPVRKGIAPMLGAPVVPLGLLWCKPLPSAVMAYTTKAREGLPPPQPEGLVLLSAIFRLFAGNR